MEENTNNYQQDFPHYGYVPARSNGFMIVSLVLGILAIMSCSLIFTSFIFGGLGILFALLSRGKDKSTTGLATGGIVTSALGIGLATVIGAVSVYLIFCVPEYHQMLNDTCEQMYGITFDEMMDGELPDYNATPDILGESQDL